MIRVQLVDLDPRFVKYFRRDDGRRYMRRVATAGEAHGIVFLCPVCFETNRGPVGTHAVEVTFAGRGAADDEGSHGRGGAPSRWIVSGDTFETLTLRPSIDLTPGCAWHGYVSDGVVTG